MSQYEKYFYELVETARLMGIRVSTKESGDFDLSTYGEFDSVEKEITLFYEKELKFDKASVFTLAHELRHAYQYLTGMHRDYWYFTCGLGPKPPAEIKDEIERDADEWAIAYFKGRNMRIPKHLVGDGS